MQNTNQDFFKATALSQQSEKKHRGAHMHTHQRNQLRRLYAATKNSPHQSLSITEEINNVLKKGTRILWPRERALLF